MAGAAFATAATARRTAAQETDAYTRYVRTSRDFKRVSQDPIALRKAFPAWLYLPWTYQWNIGYTEASAIWCEKNGINGAFLDANAGEPDTPKGKLAWIDAHHLKFYMDHSAAKHYLHLWDGGQQKPHLNELHGTGVRTVPVNLDLSRKLKLILTDNIEKVRNSPSRAAYALDDEISWGHFVHPAMWQITDDSNAYPIWLRSIYGESAPRRDKWISYEDLRQHLPGWTISNFDASPLMDQWTFNDSHWSNFIGELVEHANKLDPQTPCGIVGGQSPNAFGGYDYAKLMRKIQFIEAYDLGSSQAIIRSFNSHNAMPAVTSHFHQSADDDIWQMWYYLAHGNRGHIGWVENWFKDQEPEPWHAQVAPHYREAVHQIGPLLEGAEWEHNGIAIYYSHPSIQLSWILDAQCHGKTWINRDNDHRLGSSHLVRRAWENMLKDAGLQYNFLSYVDVIQNGIPAEYKTLILPACLCLSDAEARAIETFCKNGGTVIADYLPGAWDQHGRGRKDGACLDNLFNVRHSPDISSADMFGGKLWSETDQDAGYSYKTYRELLESGAAPRRHESGFSVAVRKLQTRQVQSHGSGKAVLLNLSPQWYNAFRQENRGETSRRKEFLQHVTTASSPYIVIEPVSAAPGVEITCFRTPDHRHIAFICMNPETGGSQEGGGNSIGLHRKDLSVTLRLNRQLRNIRNERSGKPIANTSSITLPWNTCEAIVLSFEVG